MSSEENHKPDVAEDSELRTQSPPIHHSSVHISVGSNEDVSKTFDEKDGGHNRSSVTLMISDQGDDDSVSDMKLGVDNPCYTEDEVPPVSDDEGKVCMDPSAESDNNGTFMSSSLDTSMLGEINLNSDRDAKKNKEAAEAVNLELVNMIPYSSEKQGSTNGVNGIPVKSETGDLGEGYTDPYDEYFVPVNEHRKYIRGEKLYVTKDKRKPQSWNRCICWGIGCIIVAIAIIIAILAGTGVILAQEEPIVGSEDSVQSRSFSNSQTNLTQQTEPSHMTSSTDMSSHTPSPPLIPVPDTPPTTEMYSLYVPRVIEAEFVIDNQQFKPEYADPNSEEYKKFASTVEQELKQALFDTQTLNYGAADIYVKVTQLMSGSVVVKFRIGWNFKPGLRNPPDPIKRDDVRRKLENYLSMFGGYLDSYHINMGTVRASNVIDSCQFQNGECSHTCEFDIPEKMDFVCRCPENSWLDESKKNCTPAEPPMDRPLATGPEDDHYSPGIPEVDNEADPGLFSPHEHFVDHQTEQPKNIIHEHSSEAEPENHIHSFESESESKPNVSHIEPELHDHRDETSDVSSTEITSVGEEKDIVPEKVDFNVNQAPVVAKHIINTEASPESPTDHPMFSHDHDQSNQSLLHQNDDSFQSLDITTHKTTHFDIDDKVEMALNDSDSQEFDNAVVGRSNMGTVSNEAFPNIMEQHNATTSTKPTISSEFLNDSHEHHLSPSSEEVPTEENVTEYVEPTLPAHVENHDNDAGGIGWLIPETETFEHNNTVQAEQYNGINHDNHSHEFHNSDANVTDEMFHTFHFMSDVHPLFNESETEHTVITDKGTENNDKNTIDSKENFETETILSVTTFMPPMVDSHTNESSSINMESEAVKITTNTTVLPLINLLSSSDNENVTINDSVYNVINNLPFEESFNMENDSQINALPPKEHSLFIGHHGNETEIITEPAYTLRKKPRLDDDEMFVNNPKDEMAPGTIINNTDVNVVPENNTDSHTLSHSVETVTDFPNELNDIEVHNKSFEHTGINSNINLLDSDNYVSANKSEDQNFTVDLSKMMFTQDDKVTTPVNETIIGESHAQNDISTEETEVTTLTSLSSTDKTEMVSEGHKMSSMSISDLIDDTTEVTENYNKHSSESSHEIYETTVSPFYSDSSENEHKSVSEESAYANESHVMHISVNDTHKHSADQTSDIPEHSPTTVTKETIEEATTVMPLHSESNQMGINDNSSKMLSDTITISKMDDASSTLSDLTETTTYMPIDTNMFSHSDESMISVTDNLKHQEGITTAQVNDSEVSSETENILDTSGNSMKISNNTDPAAPEDSQKIVAESVEMSSTGNPKSIMSDSSESTTNPEVLNDTLSSDKSEKSVEVVESTENIDSNNGISSEKPNDIQEVTTESVDHDLLNNTVMNNKQEEPTKEPANETMIRNIMNSISLAEDNNNIGPEINNTNEELKVQIVTETEKPLQVFKPDLKKKDTPSNGKKFYKTEYNNSEDELQILNKLKIDKKDKYEKEKYDKINFSLMPNVSQDSEELVSPPKVSQPLTTTATSIKQSDELFPSDEQDENENILRSFTDNSDTVNIVEESGKEVNKRKKKKTPEPATVVMSSTEKLSDAEYAVLLQKNLEKNDISKEKLKEEQVDSRAVGVEPAISASENVASSSPNNVSESSTISPDPFINKENVIEDEPVSEIKDHISDPLKHKHSFNSSTESTVTKKETNEKDDVADMSIPTINAEDFPVNSIIHKNDTQPALDNLTASAFSKCAAGQFQCTNGTSFDGSYCISVSSKCDSVDDCSDGSDEIGCMEKGCPGNFQCSSGQCLKRHLVCNSIVDCNDGSDEVNCDKWQCLFDEYQCPTGRCIPVLWQCDGKADCVNHTDEFNCQSSCENNEFLCPERWCISQTLKCNGIADCANGEDELLCDCSVDQFKCNTGGCVMKSQVCDGIEHCPDFSDEWNCLRLNDDTMLLEIRSEENNWQQVCADGWNSTFSDAVCQNLGYSNAVYTQKTSFINSSYYMIKPGPAASSDNIKYHFTAALQSMNNSSECESGSAVELSCQEFTCGSHSMADGIAARLVGGDRAMNGQWPSVALLYQIKQKSTCTASIISPNWLLASYNCLRSRDKDLNVNSWVVFGGGSMFDRGKPETQIREMHSIVPYPQVKYNQFLYNDDIVLIKLSEPFLFSHSVGAICLPEKEIEPRQLCVTAGWGYTSPGEINFSQYLHYLPIPTIDLAECNSTKHYAGLITQTDICAGFTDAEKSPCYNDDGAPLMCVTEGGIWEIHGILSHHSNCGRGYHPSIFSSVTAVRNWVEKTIGSKFEQKTSSNVRRR